MKELFDINATIAEIEEVIATLKELANTAEGWVIKGEHHVRVTEGNGMNGTNYRVLCSTTAPLAQIYATEEEADRNVDIYLVDGKHRHIHLRSTNAKDFFAHQVLVAQDTLRVFKELAEKQNTACHGC